MSGLVGYILKRRFWFMAGKAFKKTMESGLNKGKVMTMKKGPSGKPYSVKKGK